MTGIACIHLFISCILLLLYPIQVSGDGNVEIRLLSYRNSEAKAANGRCCDMEVICDPCENYFDVCYWGGNFSSSASCTDRIVTQTRFGDDVIFQSGPSVFGEGISNPFRFPFGREWTGRFSFKLSIWDDDSDQLVFGLDPDLIASQTVNIDSRQITNNSKPVTVVSSSAKVTLLWRVVCNDHFYGNCTVYCKAQNSDDAGHYTCDQTGKKVCNPGWTGESCRINMSVCNMQPCQNGGICTAIEGGFSCRCPDGFLGPQCEHDVNTCRSHPCLNGGTCHSKQNDYVCVCADGFNNRHCENNVDECASNPCVHGQCIDGIASYSCQEGISEESIDSGNGNDRFPIYAGAGAAGGLLLLFGIVGVVILIRRSHIPVKHNDPVATVSVSRYNNEVTQPKVVNLGVEPIYEIIDESSNNYGEPRGHVNSGNPNYGVTKGLMSPIDNNCGQDAIVHVQLDNSIHNEQREEYMVMGNTANIAYNTSRPAAT